MPVQFGSWWLLMEFSKIHWNKRGLNSLLKNIRKTDSTNRRNGSGWPKHARRLLKRTWPLTAAD